MSTTAARLVTVDEYVEGLKRFRNEDFRDVFKIQAYAKANPVDPKSLEKYLCWETGHYTRNLIVKTDLFELLAICWSEGQHSSIHNHRDQNCVMSAPIGRLRVQNYRVLEQDLEAGTCKIEKTDLVELTAENPCAVNPKEPVHSVFNPKEFNQKAVSLHIYSHPFDSCDVYSEKGTCGTIGLNYTTVYGQPVAR